VTFLLLKMKHSSPERVLAELPFIFFAEYIKSSSVVVANHHFL